MQTQQYSLVLRHKEEANTVDKQCKMCGKVVTFTDTTNRRHNANGKNIYQFAIYKCPKNHSWNKKRGIYKSFSEHVDPASIVPTEFETVPENKKIVLGHIIHGLIEITISEVDGHFRLDRALSEQIEGVSRSAISQKIKEGTILLNNCLTKPSQRLSLHDKILIKAK
ncbi:cytoplasmic protein [Bacillus sp. NEB1478]|uniref:cytoplasmic protein n=1 Tax=Bacillus sp. NEB1478 TaxID=3073816 RepID=UPI0028733BAB|nr:cytoplasmic protein [Bacillus sp. NEB1478]WNB92789.1 cytoplasmic protein [Bacillus sp. NEB1478]